MHELYYAIFSLKMTYCLLQASSKVSLSLHFIDIKKCIYDKTLSIHFEVQIYVQSLHKLDITWPTCHIL